MPKERKISLGKAQVWLHQKGGNIHIDVYHPLLQQIFENIRSTAAGPSGCGIWVGVPKECRGLAVKLGDGVLFTESLMESDDDKGDTNRA